jgi:hypothetical protein
MVQSVVSEQESELGVQNVAIRILAENGEELGNQIVGRKKH